MKTTAEQRDLIDEMILRVVFTQYEEWRDGRLFKEPELNAAYIADFIFLFTSDSRFGRLRDCQVHGICMIVTKSEACNLIVAACRRLKRLGQLATSLGYNDQRFYEPANRDSYRPAK